MTLHYGKGRSFGHMNRKPQGGTVAALAISGTAPAAWQNAPGYSFTPTVSGGSGTRSFARTGTALPTGLSFSTTTGAITGTPTAIANTTGIIITVTDSTGSQAVTVSINVVAQLTISGSPATTGTQGSAYTFTPTVTGGVGGKVWSLSGGTPPPGIGINSGTGVFSGTPTLAGTSTGLIIRVTDDIGTVSLASFNLAIASNLALSGTPGTATNGSPYTFTPTTTGGTAPYVSYASTGTALPTGLSISSSTGTISGTPTVNGTTNNCNITVTDSVGSTASLGTFSLVVSSPGAAPVNVSVPVITGTAQVGQTLTASTGSWSNSPASYAYQWKLAGSNISGATSSTYVPVTGDIGSTITCTVTATNGFGSASATSNATAAVIAAATVLAIANNTLHPVTTINGHVAQTLIHTVRRGGSGTNCQFVIPRMRNLTTIPGANLTINVFSVTPDNGANWYPVQMSGANAPWTITPWDGTDSDPTFVLTDAAIPGLSVTDGMTLTVFAYATGTEIPAWTGTNVAAMYTDENCDTSTTTQTARILSASTDTSRKTRACLYTNIVGDNTNDAWMIFGDSQEVAGSGPNPAAGQYPDHNRGIIANTLGPTLAYVNLAIGGESTDQSIMWTAFRKQQLQFVTGVVFAQFINLLENKNRKQADCKFLTQCMLPFANGKKLVLANSTPRTTGTTFTAADGSDQTVKIFSGGGTALGINSDVATLGYPILDKGVLTGMPGTLNKWAASTSGDGLHYLPYLAYTTHDATSRASWLSTLNSAPVVTGVTRPSLTLSASTGTLAFPSIADLSAVSRTYLCPSSGICGVDLNLIPANSWLLDFDVIVTGFAGTAFSISAAAGLLRTISVNTSGNLAITLSDFTVLTFTGTGVADGNNHTVRITCDLAGNGGKGTYYLQVDGGTPVSASNTTGVGGVSPVINMRAQNTGPKVGIRNIAINRARNGVVAASYTPTAYTGAEANLVALYSMNGSAAATVGPVLPT